jgi:hypothetical protein
MDFENANPAAGDDGARQDCNKNCEPALYSKLLGPEQVLGISGRPNNDVLCLACALRALLETAERDYCPQWPVRTPGVPEHVRAAAVEYRRDRGRR